MNKQELINALNRDATIWHYRLLKDRLRSIRYKLTENIPLTKYDIQVLEHYFKKYTHN